MTIPTAMLLNPDNSGRPIDARWQRIIDLAARGEPATHRWDDDWVRRGLEYLNRRNACRNDDDLARLAGDAPDIDAAYRLRVTADRLARAELEGRMLAGQPVGEVARLCGVRAGAVEAYEALFFAVTAALGAKHHLLIHAVGSKLWDGTLTAADADLLVRWVAVIKGPLLMELMLRYLRRGLVLPDRLECASAEELAEVASMLEVRALVMVWTTPWPKCLRGLRLYELAEELRAYAAGRAGVPASGIGGAAGAFTPGRAGGPPGAPEVSAA